MNIDGVNNGIVIDHIEAGKGIRIYEQLQLNKLDCSVAIIQNVASEKYGKKDIIKVDQDIPLDFDVLGYMDPHITVNHVKDGKLASKVHLELPETLTNVIRCKNPRCITTTERSIEHIFKLTDRKNKVYRCLYCETQAQ